MNIEYVNGYWVPSNDIHIAQWKAGDPFTQNKGLVKFIEYLDRKNLKFNSVLDIGAWCGTWSNAISKYANLVHAFEPDQLHYDCLIKNINDNVVAHNCAVGSTKSKVSLKTEQENFTQGKRVVPNGEILMTTVDSFAIKDIDLIKIDVEGYEMEVLKGANNALDQCTYVMIELNNNSKKYGSNNRQITKYLIDKGFSVLIKTWPDVIFVNNYSI